MPDLVQQVAAAATRDLTVSRTGTGRVYYTARAAVPRPGPGAWSPVRTIAPEWRP